MCSVIKNLLSYLAVQRIPKNHQLRGTHFPPFRLSVLYEAWIELHWRKISKKFAYIKSTDVKDFEFCTMKEESGLGVKSGQGFLFLFFYAYFCSTAHSLQHIKKSRMWISPIFCKRSLKIENWSKIVKHGCTCYTFPFPKYQE